MAIDDPIQDLDSLNVHSLVELMRREFVGKYQLIMSAHSELDVNYMKYKFGVACEGKPIIDIDVQETFFKAKQMEVIS
jgi:exonuclease SbcC